MVPGKEDERQNRAILFGCALAGLLALLLLGAAVVVAVNRDRNLAHYPGATLVTSHSNYGGLPSRIRWDNSYFTTDNFTDVYNWYSITFGLGAETRAMERCILLDGPTDQFILRRYVSVLLCSTPEGQMIFVTRSTELMLPR